MKHVRRGAHYLLRPVGLDANKFRVTQWTDYLVCIVRPSGSPRNRAAGRCYVETRQGDFIGLVLIASLHPLDRRTRNALRREARRAAQSRK